MRTIITLALAAVLGLSLMVAKRYRSLHAYKLSEQAYHAPSPKSLTKAQALEDGEYLQALMEKAYGGRFMVTDSEWQKIFAGMTTNLEALPDGKIPTRTLAETMVKALAPFEDGHLQIGYRTGENYQRFVAKARLIPYLIQSKDEANCPLPDGTEVVEGRYFDRSSGTMDKSAIALVPKGKRFDCARAIHQYSPKKEVKISPPSQGWQYIRIGSSYSKQYYSELKDAAQKVDGQNNLIFDLRGNTGGDNTLDYNLVHALGLPFTNPYDKGITHTSPSALQLQWNATRWLYATVNPEGAKKRLAMLEDQMWEYFWNIRGDRLVLSVPPKPPAGKTFNKNIVVIADGNCMSACESLIKVLRAYSQTTLIGTNTSGGVKIGDVASAILPHSILRVELGRTYNPVFADSSEYSERTGFLPDVWLSTSDITPQEAIVLAQKLTAVGH